MDFWESINGADSKFRFALTLDGYFEYFFRFVIVSMHDEYNYSCVFGLGLGNMRRLNPHRDFVVQEGEEDDPRIKESGPSKGGVTRRYSFFVKMDNPVYFHQPQLYTYFGDREKFRERGHHLRVKEYPRYYNPRIFKDNENWGSIPFILDELNTNLWYPEIIERGGNSNEGRRTNYPILHYEFWELIRLLVIEFRDCRGNWDSYLSSNTVEYVKRWLALDPKSKESVLLFMSRVVDINIQSRWSLSRFSAPNWVDRSPSSSVYYDSVIFNYQQFVGLAFNRIHNPYYFMDGDRFYRSIIETAFYNSDEGVCLTDDPSEKEEAWRWGNDGNRTFHSIRYCDERRSRDEEISVRKDWIKENFIFRTSVHKSFRKFNSKMYVRSVSDYHSFFELRRMVLDSLNRSTFHSSWRTTFRDSYGIVKDIFGFWNGEEYRYNFGFGRRDRLITGCPPCPPYRYSWNQSDSVFGLGFIFPDSAIYSFRKDWIIWIEPHSSYSRRPEFQNLTEWIGDKNFISKYKEFRFMRDNDLFE